MENNQNSVSETKRPTFFSPIFLILVGLLLVVGTFVTSYIADQRPRPKISPKESFNTPKPEFKKFSSEADFKEFLQQSINSNAGFMSKDSAASRMQTSGDVVQAPVNAAYGFSGLESTNSAPDRVSQTNVQVLGIDEPDMVKNNNRSIFYRNQSGYYGRPVPLMQEKMMIAPAEPVNDRVNIINAFPPETMIKISQIQKGGDLLLQDNTLIVLGSEAIVGYDVSAPATPKEKWKMDIKTGNYLVESRLYNGKLYLVLQNNLNTGRPCPLKPVALRGQDIVIDCTSIYHPAPSINADSTFTAMVINPVDGTAQNTLSFVGSSSGSTIYMSPNALYLAYTMELDAIAYLSKFFEEKASDIIPFETRERLKKLQTYDISYIAKMTEMQQILQTYLYSSGGDTQIANQNELENRMKTYSKEHRRELRTTQLVKLSTTNLEQVATAVVPGTPLNQFSLDEYNENLRIAVTIGGWSEFGNVESTNDLYVLDKNLRARGNIKDLGVTEQIYSARFIGDKGYLVTFKQVDPFYVMDLSNPDSPQVKGELKIPGFSSYLHPLKQNLILGIGREDSQVKASLFDVADPTHPLEISKYILKDYSSEILQTHHAFLHDDKNELFFVPGSNNGYVLSYKENKLSLVKAISDIAPQRALYMNDYLYVLGQNEIVVFNELNWSEVKRLKLE